MPKRHFVIVGSDMTGLGWCKWLADAGESVCYAYEMDDSEFDKPEEKERFYQIGMGICPTMTIEDAEKLYFDREGVYWVFDTNHCSEFSEHLRMHNKRVFGASELSAKMEYDRNAGMEAAKKAGLGIADMIECSTLEEGIAYLEAHPDIAYVFKPNESHLNYLTFVPQHEDAPIANHTLQVFLKNFQQDISKGFILQERKNGVEVNFELMLVDGEPWLATCGLESKRILNHDLGEHCGCAQDIFFLVDMQCKGVQETVWKLLPPYRATKYTGMIDVNCIIADDNVWFLENCNRFGYSAHPNFFSTLAMRPFGDVIADWTDGYVNPKDFRSGFGASVNLYTEHPRPGWPIVLSDKAKEHFYPYDLYKDGDDYLLTGYSGDIGVVTGHGYTIEDAAEKCYDILHRHRVWSPDAGYRSDLAKCDYPSSPLKRYQALDAMGMFDVA